MFAGSSFFIFINSFLTPSVTLIKFASVCFNIPRPIISSPLPLKSCLVSSGPISIFATSPNLTKEKSFPFFTTRF